MPASVENLTVTEDTLTVEFSDGRTLLVPLAWFPRLLHASPQERNNWRLICKGHGIHWDDLDEDISVEGLLAGRPSGESQASFKKWVEGRELMEGRTLCSPGRSRANTRFAPTGKTSLDCELV